MANKKIKVLQFSIAASAGGRTQFLLNLWRNIDRKKFIFDFITFSEKLNFEDELIESGANVFYIHNYPENNKDGFVREFNKILSNRYDVIHIATSYWKDTIIEELARQAGIKKIIIHSHSSGINAVNISDNNALKKHINIKNHLKEDIATDYIACSKAASEWLFGNQIPKKLIKIIYNGINTGRFKFKSSYRKIIRDRLNINDCFVLGFVGRLEMVKNIIFIIEILKNLVKIDTKVKLIIVGNGTLRESLIKKVNELDMSEYVLFLGQIEDVEKYFMVFDVFLLPSFFEGFPLSLIEAQCSGLKCIVNSGITEEVAITDLVYRISLNSKGEWLKTLLEIKRGYERRDYSKEIKALGFDTKNIAKE